MFRVVNRMRLFAAVAVGGAHIALYGLLPERHLDAVIISLAANLVSVYALAPHFAAWLLTKDLKRIQDFVETLKNGDLKTRLPVRPDSVIDADISEVNQLHQSLNWMARQIEIRERKIKEQLEEVVQREKELKDLVVRDPMTRLYNRQFFHERVAQALSQLQRHGRPFALAIIDVDFFKKINDTHGHLAGDAVLLTLSDLLCRQVRDEDVVARIGGEEFGVLVANAGADMARAVLGRIRHAVETMDVTLDDGRTLSITVSIGYAAAQCHVSQTHDDLFHQADMALYHVKRNGRNGVMDWRH